MRSTALRLLFTLIHGVLVTSLAGAAEDSRPTLVVRTYEVAPVAASSWSAAVRTAGALLARARIRVEWVHCSSWRAGEPDSGPPRCAMSYGRNEVVLRVVVPPTSDPLRPMVLGDSMLDGTSHSGMLATVYLDRVEWLAREAHVSTDVVLARAMAHELGHLLLGTSTHSARGLMRPVWTPEEVARNEPRDWQIPADDGARMRMAFSHRLTSPGANATN
jgi:hypothetical protein